MRMWAAGCVCMAVVVSARGSAWFVVPTRTTRSWGAAGAGTLQQRKCQCNCIKSEKGGHKN